MTYLINLLESLIAVWLISEYCNIEYRKSFILSTTALSFIACCICDYYEMVSWPLLCSYICIWFFMVSIYTKKSYLYNFLVVIVSNYIINISLIIPLLFVYHKSIILASIIAKALQLLISFAFVQYRKKYMYIHNKYWILVLIILLCSMIIMEKHLNDFFLGNISISTGIMIITSFIIALIALMFFHVIERFSEEHKIIEKKLEREKYRNLTYDMINHSKRELDYLSHGLTHRIKLVKNYLEQNNYENALNVVDNYIDEIEKHSTIINTGNSYFDVLFSLNSQDLNYEMIKTINIPVKEFYDSISFVNFIIELLKQLKENNTVYFGLEDKGIYCLITLTSNECFYDKEKMEAFFIDFKDDYSSYVIEENKELYLIKINIRIDNENYL